MNNFNTKAMILAAGLGTRLQPFTLEHPKALYSTGGKTLLEHAISHLVSYGIIDIIINLHHFANQIIKFVEEHNYFNCRIVFSDESGELLETGGGLKKASWFLETGGAFIVRNVDILSDLRLDKLIEYHSENNALATLAVRDRPTSRYFLFQEDWRLAGWENRRTGQKILAGEESVRLNGLVIPDLFPMAFSGIQVLEPEIFPLITEQGSFSLTNLYLRLAESQRIYGFPETGTLWKDIGTAGH